MVETVFTQKPRRAEFILTEQDGHLSREVGILAAGQVLVAGTVLQRSGANLVAYGGAEDSSGALIGDAAGILYDNVDTSVTGLNADTKVTYVARLAEVKLALLTFPPNSSAGTEEAEMIASLAKVDIICR
jgi:hypothetical protein